MNIIELLKKALPSKVDYITHMENKQSFYEGNGHNRAIQKVEDSLPQLLEIIAGEIKSTQDKYCGIDKKTKEQTYSGGGQCRECGKRRDALEIDDIIKMLTNK